MIVGAVVLLAAAGTLLRRSGSSSLPSPPPHLLVVGLDGADWAIVDPLLARGDMPNLARLIASGTRARLHSAQPMLSPVLWTTIATGVSPERHGIVDFVTLRGGGEAVPVTSTERRVPAFWNRLSEAGLRVGVTGWWATYPAEPIRGFVISDRVAYTTARGSRRSGAGKVSPAEAWDDVLLETVRPADLTDEDVAPWLEPAAGEPTEEMESVESEIRSIVAGSRTYERSAARLARRYNPEVEAFYIQQTDTVAHLTMPWRAPLLPGTDERLAARFGGALDQAYRDADRQIGEVVARAGAGANVVVLSDHGFHSGTDRPRSTASRIGRGRAADWHRPWGILVLSGPSIRRAAPLDDPRLVDIAPTLLALEGVAVPEDLEGRVLDEALTDGARRSIRREARRLAAGGTAQASIPDEAAGPDASPAEGEDPERQAVLDRLVSLGYLGSDSLNARNNRGILALNRGDYREAMDEFRSALDADPRQPAVLVNLARAQWLSGDPTGAKGSLDAALEIEPRSREAINLAGNIAMGQGDLHGAEALFRRALAFEPDDPDLHNSLGLLFEAASRWNDALEEYLRVVAVDPDYAGGYVNAGNALRRLGRDAEAEEWYRRATRADPSFAASWNNLAMLAQDRGDVRAAEPLYRKAIALAPKDPRSHNNLGSLLVAAGRLDEALVEFRQAARLDPEYPEPHNGMGAVFGRLGRAEDEIAAYREALRIRPGYLDARYNLGLALLRRPGSEGEGEEQLKSVLAADPGYQDAADALARLEQSRSRPGRPAASAAASATTGR